MRAKKGKLPERKAIDYDHWYFQWTEWLRYGGTGLAFGLFTVWICYQSFYALPLALGICILWIRQKKKALIRQRREQLTDHFKDFISSLHTALRAGYSVENGVRSAAADLRQLYGAGDTLVLELQGILQQMEYRVPVEKLFLEFGRRCGVEDIRSFGEILSIAKRTGGNLSKVLHLTWHTICEKIDTEQEIRTMISAQRMEQTVMNFMPACMILYLRLSFSGFLEQLYGNLQGICIMTFCLLIYLSALLLSGYLLRIEV